jgi:NAD(P)-dependent dehydrogenase (short-subunit alcohol dehydrogenase family)
MSDRWSGKVVVVTGASAGLGLAIAEAFSAVGANVALVARGREALELAAAKLRSAGSDVLAVTADVTVDADVTRMVDETLARFGRIDVLVNNAGKSARGRILDTTPDDFRHLIDVNLLSTVRCTRAAAPSLIASRGQIVNIGSLAGKAAARWIGAYAAAKFAVTAYTQQLRLELADDGVHAMLVCPGPIARTETRSRDTDRLENLPAEASKPGAGVKTKPLDPAWLAREIVRGCEERRGELVYPWVARLLFAIGQLSSKWGDWLIRRKT